MHLYHSFEDENFVVVFLLFNVEGVCTYPN